VSPHCCIAFVFSDLHFPFKQLIVSLLATVNIPLCLNFDRWQTAQVSYLNLEEPPLNLVMEDCVSYVE
jgi:hypothetical protein